MYTLEQLQQKNLKELKEIGWQLNVLPDGDRRCRQNWINALVGVQPPLLQLLEDSPGVEPVEDVFEFSEEELDRLQEMREYYRENEDLEPPEGLYLTADQVANKLLLEVQAQEPPIKSKFGRIVYPKPAVKPIAQNAETRPQLDRTESADVHNWRSHPAESVRDSSSAKAEALGSKEGDRVLVLAGNSEAVRGGVLPCQPDELETSPGVSFDIEEFQKTHAVEIEDYFASFNDEQPPNRGDGKGRIEPKLSQSAIVPAAKNSPGVSRKTSTAHQLLELFKSSAVILDDSPAGETEAELLESAIVPATENLPRSESDPGPILTGIRLSDTFLARYSRPQPEIIYQSDPDGQLSLLNFEVESVDEPPDPDDFPSIDAFNEAMARWDAENAEALMGSMDSMCEWAPCPAEWYEPEPSEVMEVAPSSDHLLSSSDHYEVRKCWNFSIPTFDAWCDRAARQTDTDEPPDTGSFARLPGPKPPSFPPMSVAKCDRANSIRNFARGAICAIGRAPPGGDAMH